MGGEMVLNTAMVAMGCVGGVLPDVLRVVKNLKDNAAIGFLGTGRFWLGFVLQMALGGFVVWLLEVAAYKEAVAVGFSAPEIISKLAAKAKEQPPSPTPGRVAVGLGAAMVAVAGAGPLAPEAEGAGAELREERISLAGGPPATEAKPGLGLRQWWAL